MNINIELSAIDIENIMKIRNGELESSIARIKHVIEIYDKVVEAMDEEIDSMKFELSIPSQLEDILRIGGMIK